MLGIIVSDKMALKDKQIKTQIWIYPLGNYITYPTLGKRKLIFKNALGRGYVSSQEVSRLVKFKFPFQG